MFNLFGSGQTGDGPGSSMEQLSTITYYTLNRDPGYLAIVRYTAYGFDRQALRICEDIYADDPEDFCRLEADIEIALESGIDASVISHYDSAIFPVITSYLEA